MVEPVSIVLIVISATASIVMATSGLIMIIKNFSVADIKDFFRSIGKKKVTYNRSAPQGGGTSAGFAAVCKFLVDNRTQMKDCKHWITETLNDSKGSSRTFKLPAPGDSYQFQLKSGTKIWISSFSFIPASNPYINGFNVYGDTQNTLDEFVKIALAKHLDPESLKMVLDQELEQVEVLDEKKATELTPLNPQDQYYANTAMNSAVHNVYHGHNCHNPLH